MSKPSRQVTMAVFRECWHWNDESDFRYFNIADHHLQQAIYLLGGSVHSSDCTYNPGIGFYLRRNSRYTSARGAKIDLIRFLFVAAQLSSDELSKQCDSLFSGRAELVACQSFETTDAEMVLRLDQVNFPPGAVAHRHTHPGGGIRYLTCGTLQLHGSGRPHEYAKGEAWFEAANSPVLAMADSAQASQFVRMMLLPARFEGQPTFSLLDEADAEKPRLQTNTRFFDLPLLIN